MVLNGISAGWLKIIDVCVRSGYGCSANVFKIYIFQFAYSENVIFKFFRKKKIKFIFEFVLIFKGYNKYIISIYINIVKR